MSTQHRESFSRSSSTPVISQTNSQKVSFQKSFGHTNGVSRLTGGDFAHATGGSSAHIPGYRGHVPGFRFEQASLGSTFSSATSTLELQLRNTQGFAPPTVKCPHGRG